MLLKTSLHFHTNEDPEDVIDHSTEEGIDTASNLGFDVLALTCHGKVIHSKEHEEYAESKGILLIPGIELNIGERMNEKRHLIVLNCEKDAEGIDTFKDLENYKKDHPYIFVIAPHPYYPDILSRPSLMEYAERYAHLFDAIEHSWFYSKYINKNKKAEKLAKEKNLPLVATSDTHFFEFLDTDYCVVEAERKTPEAVFESIKKGKFSNVTRAKRSFGEMCMPYGTHVLGKLIGRKIKENYKINIPEGRKKIMPN